jgi:hypothetical protein
VRFVILLVLMAAPVAALASDSYPEGFVNVDSYVWTKGRWYKDGQFYTATKTYYTEPYYYCGRCYTRERYRYAYVPVAEVKPALPSYRDPLWREKVLDLVAYRDRVEAQKQLEALQQAEFVETIQVLGLQDNFRWEGYGSHVPYASPLRFRLSAAGVQGNTVYGYERSTIADLYSSVDLNVALQQAGRLVEGVQRLEGNANQNYQDNVRALNDGAAKIAEIRAKGDILREMLREPDRARIEQREYSYRASTGADGRMKVERVDVPNVGKLWEAHAKKECSSCHSGEEPKGNFEWTTYPALPATGDRDKVGITKEIVLERLITHDLDKRMPRNPEGGPGRKITPKEYNLWAALAGSD